MPETPFENLLKVMPPPNQPFAASGDWAAVEHSLGLSLPKDYKFFIERYGMGKICSFLYVVDFFALEDFSPSDFVRMTHSCYTAYQDSPPYPLYPQTHGLIPLANTDNGDLVNWRERDGSEDIVVSEGHCDEFILLEGFSFTSFLLGLQPGDQGILHKMPFSDKKFRAGLNFKPLIR